MNPKFALLLAALIAVPASAGQDGESASEDTVAAPGQFPAKLWGIYGRNKSACRAKGFGVAGKIGIRRNMVIVEGQPFEIGEVLDSSELAMNGDFTAPGGWGAPVRMSFTIRHGYKLMHRTFDGRHPPRAYAFWRCKNR